MPQNHSQPRKGMGIFLGFKLLKKGWSQKYPSTTGHFASHLCSEVLNVETHRAVTHLTESEVQEGIGSKIKKMHRNGEWLQQTFPFGVLWESSFGQMLMSSCHTRNPLPHPWLGASGQGELKLPLSPVTTASSWLQFIIKAKRMYTPQDWFHLGPTTCPRINSNARYHHHLS